MKETYELFEENGAINIGKNKHRVYEILRVKKMFPSLYNSQAKLNSKIEEGILQEVV